MLPFVRLGYIWEKKINTKRYLPFIPCLHGSSLPFWASGCLQQSGKKITKLMDGFSRIKLFAFLFIYFLFDLLPVCCFFLVNNYVKNESAQCSHLYKEHTAELSFSSQPTAASLLRQTPSVHLSSQSSLVWLQQGGWCFPSSPCWTPRYRKPNKNSHYLHRILIIEFCND